MKAIRCGQPASLDALALVDLPDPLPPSAGEISVRLRASSLNFHDYAVAAGHSPHTPGVIPMSDGAGEVIAIGDGVTEYAVGDRVVSTFFPYWLDGGPPVDGFARVPGDGIDGYAREAVTAPATWFTRAPAGFSHEEAATLTCAGVTAWRALFVQGALKPGETVLVQGTGGVSLFALLFAKAIGCTVIATSSNDDKLERLRSLGADELINYRSCPDWGARALRLTGGRGVDHVVEVGGPATLDQSMTAVRVGGHVAMIGVLTGLAGPVSTVMMLGKHLRIQGLIVGSRADQLDLIRAVESWRIRPVLDRSFPLDQLADAFRYQESNRHFGKITVTI